MMAKGDQWEKSFFKILRQFGIKEAQFNEFSDVVERTHRQANGKITITSGKTIDPPHFQAAAKRFREVFDKIYETTTGINAQAVKIMEKHGLDVEDENLFQRNVQRLMAIQKGEPIVHLIFFTNVR